MKAAYADSTNRLGSAGSEFSAHSIPMAKNTADGIIVDAARPVKAADDRYVDAAEMLFTKQGDYDAALAKVDETAVAVNKAVSAVNTAAKWYASASVVANHAATGYVITSANHRNPVNLATWIFRRNYINALTNNAAKAKIEYIAAMKSASDADVNYAKAVQMADRAAAEMEEAAIVADHAAEDLTKATDGLSKTKAAVAAVRTTEAKSAYDNNMPPDAAATAQGLFGDPDADARNWEGIVDWLKGNIRQR